jgi:hypothetical protein
MLTLTLLLNRKLAASLNDKHQQIQLSNDPNHSKRKTRIQPSQIGIVGEARPGWRPSNTATLRTAAYPSSVGGSGNIRNSVGYYLATTTGANPIWDSIVRPISMDTNTITSTWVQPHRPGRKLFTTQATTIPIWESKGNVAWKISVNPIDYQCDMKQ